VAHRVDVQFARGLVDEVRQLIASGVPTSAHAFSGLVYRQVLELLAGVRDEAATRRLIVQENVRYAKRQLTWFKREPGVHWLDASEGVASVTDEAVDLVRRFTASRSAPAAHSVTVDSPSA
jgi:tRNA dimethylallyltransferase